jgi:NhaP-type Na+/H+ and K+/H+ antiporter
LFRFKLREKLFIAWVGLRGAVPIVMATLPVLAADAQSVQAAEALDAFDIVFFVVIVSAIFPGATVPRAARWLEARDMECVGDESCKERSAPPVWGGLWRRPAAQRAPAIAAAAAISPPGQPLA